MNNPVLYLSLWIYRTYCFAKSCKTAVSYTHLTVAIHTYSHQYATIYQSVDAYFEDLYKAQQIIKDVTGVDSKLVRLPGGTATAKSYCKKYSGSEDTFPQIMKRLEEEGYTVSDWNIDTKDWESSTTVDGIISSVHRVAQAWHDNNLSLIHI